MSVLDSYIGGAGRQVRFHFHRTRHGEVVWRLVGPNNRVLGVSPAGFGGDEAAVRAAHDVRSHAASGTITVILEPSRQWRWSLTDDDLGVFAVSAHGYERRTTCEIGVRRFMAGAATALIDRAIGRRGRFWRS